MHNPPHTYIKNLKAMRIYCIHSSSFFQSFRGKNVFFSFKKSLRKVVDFAFIIFVKLLSFLLIWFILKSFQNHSNIGQSFVLSDPKS